MHVNYKKKYIPQVGAKITIILKYTSTSWTIVCVITTCVIY